MSDSLCNEPRSVHLYIQEETLYGSFTSNKKADERPWRTDSPSSAPKQALSLYTHSAEGHTVEYTQGEDAC